MNIHELAAEIVDLVQAETSNKTSEAKIRRQIVGILNKIVSNFSEAEEDGDYVVVVNLQQGVPESIYSNHPGICGALFVCTDNISVADDEETAVIIYEDVIVVGVGEVEAQDDMAQHTRAAIKFERQNND